MEFIINNPEYFAPLPDLGMALERIGLRPEEDLSPSLENLLKIMRAHTLSVPYETLDIVDYHRWIDFSIPHLFEKFVINRRGGYCYEINGFFMSLLLTLGYDCYPLMGRLLFGGIRIGEMGHRTTIVRIGGVEYLCDVGYGAGIADGPIQVYYDGIQDVEGRKFSIRHHDGDEFGDMTLIRHTDKGEEEFYTVYKRPNTVLEFGSTNYFLSTSAWSSFRNRRAVHLRRPDGSISIDNKTYRVKKGDRVTEEEIASYERLYEILTADFGMIVPRLSFSSDFPRKWFYLPRERKPDGSTGAGAAYGAGEGDKRGKYLLANPEYFAPLPDIDAALARIGLNRETVAEKSRENLGRIILACLRAIPFENLDIYDYRRRIDTSLPHLHEKIVLHRRGGYCYELNSFLSGLLLGIGYDCIIVGTRLWRNPPTLGTLVHCTTIVAVDGIRYLCDIGLGGENNATGPVELDSQEVQEINGRNFQVEHHPKESYGDVTLYRFSDNGREPMMSIYTRNQSPLELIRASYYQSNHPTSRFTTNRTVRLFTETGSIAIENNIFRRRVGGEKIEEEITSNKRLYEILTEEFNMIVPKISMSPSLPRLWF